MESPLDILLPPDDIAPRPAVDAPAGHDELRQSLAARNGAIQQTHGPAKGAASPGDHSPGSFWHSIFDIQRAHIRKVGARREEMARHKSRLADSLGPDLRRVVSPVSRARHAHDHCRLRLRLSERVSPPHARRSTPISKPQLTHPSWYIAASATVLGSTASFLASRSLLKSFVDRLIKGDKRFAALALTLKHDGLKLLVMIRLCPLPYSLSNGAIATFPTVHWASYGLATAIISPKLMLHIFIGSQLEKIAESGGKMDPKTKAISYISIAIGAIAGIVTGWFMYKKTRERAAQLEAEERAGIRRASVEDLEREYSDDPEALGAAETLREEDDDISLNTTWDDEYHDEPAVTEDDAVEIGDDPFKDGDGDASEEENGKK